MFNDIKLISISKDPILIDKQKEWKVEIILNSYLY